MARSLEERLKAMEEKQRRTAAERDEANTPSQEDGSWLLPEIDAEVMLGKISEDKLAIPNIILRSSLFGIIKNNERRFINNVFKVSINGNSLKQTGPELGQSDLDVWGGVMRLAREDRLGETIYFRSNEFLRSIGRSEGSKNREWLYESIRRMMATVIEISDGKHTYTGQLIHHWERNEGTKKNHVVINPKIAPFFQGALWTGVKLEERIQLKGKQLALWLHGFYSTHRIPFNYKVATLLKECGSDADLNNFRGMLKVALPALSAVTGWTCWIEKETDLVHVVKTKAVHHE